MKTSKISALLLVALIAATASVGCMSNKKSSTSTNEEKTTRSSSVSHDSPVNYEKIGTNVIEGELGKEVEVDDTVFTLNAVIDPGARESEKKFIYFDITLKNNTPAEYNLSTINNFYVSLPEGDIYSDVQTQLYANSHFAENKYFVDPFTIPSNGQFSGIIGGFKLEENANEFTVCFYPTGNDANNKETVIKYEIKADDITAPSDEVLK